MIPRLPQIRVPVDLHRLFPEAEFVEGACTANGMRVFDAADHSRAVLPGMMFAAIPGFSLDGKDFVSEAVSHGATGLLVESRSQAEVPQCVVPNVRAAYGRICQALAGDPSRDLNLVGVTGTNGKTTVTWLLRSMFRAAGYQAGLLGTVEYHDGKIRSEASLTTPDSKSLADWLSAMVWHGTTHAACELSSHALDQDRASGVELAAGVVTNITHEHLDYHHNVERYAGTKARIARLVHPDGAVVLNADDKNCRRLAEDIADREIVWFGNDTENRAAIIEQTLSGSVFQLRCGIESREVTTRLVGLHNVANCVAAAAAARSMDLSFDAICAGIESLDHVPGRMEPVRLGQDFQVFVDYAHTPDALSRCLQTLRELTPGRLVCVFGAGGDRDVTKRPAMGKAATLADEVIITSDNPRSEKPLSIARDVLAGIDGKANATIELNRKRAINHAVSQAKAGDCVLIAGKGHEADQIIGTERLAFRDVEIVRNLLSASRSQLSRVA